MKTAISKFEKKDLENLIDFIKYDKDNFKYNYGIIIDGVQYDYIGINGVMIEISRNKDRISASKYVIVIYGDIIYLNKDYKDLFKYIKSKIPDLNIKILKNKEMNFLLTKLTE